jgi:ribose 5-phosphate isomerase
MGPISSPGIGSGLDVQSIVTQLVALEKAPLTQLKTQATSFQTKLSSRRFLLSVTPPPSSRPARAGTRSRQPRPTPPPWA